MGEIKKFIPPTPSFQEKAGQAKERPKPFETTQGKPEKPADVIDIESARQKKQERTPFSFPDTEPEELMETISGLVQKVFAESRDKNKVITQLRKLTEDLELKLKR